MQSSNGDQTVSSYSRERQRTWDCFSLTDSSSESLSIKMRHRPAASDFFTFASCLKQMLDYSFLTKCKTQRGVHLKNVDKTWLVKHSRTARDIT